MRKKQHRHDENGKRITVRKRDHLSKRLACRDFGPQSDREVHTVASANRSSDKTPSETANTFGGRTEGRKHGRDCISSSDLVLRSSRTRFVRTLETDLALESDMAPPRSLHSSSSFVLRLVVVVVVVVVVVGCPRRRRINERVAR